MASDPTVVLWTHMPIYCVQHQLRRRRSYFADVCWWVEYLHKSVANAHPTRWYASQLASRRAYRQHDDVYSVHRTEPPSVYTLVVVGCSESELPSSCCTCMPKIDNHIDKTHAPSALAGRIDCGMRGTFPEGGNRVEVRK